MGVTTGVTATTVKVGDLTDLTGTLASSTDEAAKAFQAHIDLQNAHGGVDGRKIQVVTADGASTPTGELNAAQQLVQSDHVFAVASDTYLMATVANYFKQQSIPVVGMGIDGGPEWAEDSNMFNSMGDTSTPLNAAQYTAYPDFYKKLHITDVAAVGYGDEAGSAAATTGFGTAAKAVGLDPVFINTSSSIAGGFNADSIVLGIKHSGAKGVMSQLDEQDTVSLLTAAKQAGLTNVVFSSSVYSQAVLDDSSVASALDGSYAWTFQQPVELQTAATKTEESALQKYSGITGAPDVSGTMGWMAADVLIKGLEVTGKNLGRTSFMTSLRHVNNYNGEGLQAWTVNMANYGKNIPQFCLYYVQVKNDAFVPQSKAPICGTPVGS